MLEVAARFDARPEAQSDSCRSRIDTGNLGCFGRNLKARSVKQDLRLLRRLAETIGEFILETVQLLLVPDAREATVQSYANVLIRNPGVGETAAGADLDVGSPVLDGLTTNASQRLFKQVLIKIDPNQLYVARLLLAEEVARPTHVQITSADRESSTEPVKGLQGLKPRHRPGRDFPTWLG